MIGYYCSNLIDLKAKNFGDAVKEAKKIIREEEFNFTVKDFFFANDHVDCSGEIPDGQCKEYADRINSLISENSQLDRRVAFGIYKMSLFQRDIFQKSKKYQKIAKLYQEQKDLLHTLVSSRKEADSLSACSHCGSKIATGYRKYIAPFSMKELVRKSYGFDLPLEEQITRLYNSFIEGNDVINKGMTCRSIRKDDLSLFLSFDSRNKEIAFDAFLASCPVCGEPFSLLSERFIKKLVGLEKKRYQAIQSFFEELNANGGNLVYVLKYCATYH